jgi:hypothetical protein
MCRRDMHAMEDGVVEAVSTREEKQGIEAGGKLAHGQDINHPPTFLTPPLAVTTEALVGKSSNVPEVSDSKVVGIILLSMKASIVTCGVGLYFAFFKGLQT